MPIIKKKIKDKMKVENKHNCYNRWEPSFLPSDCDLKALVCLDIISEGTLFWLHTDIKASEVL